MKQYYIVILNWNGWKDTEKCIESILEYNISNNYNIILVDNGSREEEINLISNYCNEKFKIVIENDKDFFLEKNIKLKDEFKQEASNKKIIFIKNNENLGFSAGNNVALKFLNNLKEDYALLLNNDTEIEKDALEKMFQYLINNEYNKVVAVIPQIRFYEPKNIIWNCGGSINWLGVRKYYYAFKNVKDVPQEGLKNVDYGTGCALMLNISKTGLLSETYFLGEEDMELAYRLKNNKMKIVCLYNSILYHKVGASRGKISEEKMGNMVYHYSLRMSNLKEQLLSPIWVLSFLAHYFSTIRLLRKESFFSLKKINAMWKDIYFNVNNIKKYTHEDFIKITNKKY